MPLVPDTNIHDGQTYGLGHMDAHDSSRFFYHRQSLASYARRPKTADATITIDATMAATAAASAQAPVRLATM